MSVIIKKKKKRPDIARHTETMRSAERAEILAACRNQKVQLYLKTLQHRSIGETLSFKYGLLDKAVTDKQYDDIVKLCNSIDLVSDLHKNEIKTDKKGNKLIKHKNTAYRVFDFDYGMTIKSYYEHKTLIDMLIELTVNNVMMVYQYYEKWLWEGSLAKFLVDKNPRLVKVIEAMCVTLLVTDARSKVGPQRVCSKINKILSEKGATAWLHEEVSGDFSAIIKLIKGNAATYQAIITGTKMATIRDKESIIHYTRHRGELLIEDAQWLINHFGDSFSLICMHPHTIKFLNCLYSKYEHLKKNSLQFLSDMEENIRYYVTPMGIMFINTSTKKGRVGLGILDRVIVELNNAKNNFENNYQIDITEFDDDMSRFTGFYLNSYFDIISSVADRKLLVSLSEQIYGDGQYELHALQILCNHILCLILASVEIHIDDWGVYTVQKYSEFVNPEMNVQIVDNIVKEQIITLIKTYIDPLRIWIKKHRSKYKI